MAATLSPLEGLASLGYLRSPVLLESSTGRPGEVSLVTAEPTTVLQGRIETDWHIVTNALKINRVEEPCHRAPPAGGLFGWVGFDGEFCFGVYPHVLAFDHGRCSWSEWGTLSERFAPRSPASLPILDFQPLIARDEFIAAVRRAQNYITAGDIYQVNLSHPWQAKWPLSADPLAFYRMLREASPAPYAAYVDLGGRRVFSSSPECFLRMSGSHIETRPIKGTRPRFPLDMAEDEASARALTASAKERAELLMITDLERNDLGQVCEYGSIIVPELAAVESFAQVFHLVSTVQGTLRAEVDHAAAFKACFPGGSISGAPKKRALEIIAELERHPRGLYTGAIGYFGFNGQSQFNIVIRTAVQQGDTISFHAGAGIVADSVPELEYEETLHKASGLLKASRR